MGDERNGGQSVAPEAIHVDTFISLLVGEHPDITQDEAEHIAENIDALDGTDSYIRIGNYEELGGWTSFRDAVEESVRNTLCGGNFFDGQSCPDWQTINTRVDRIKRTIFSSLVATPPTGDVIFVSDFADELQNENADILGIPLSTKRARAIAKAYAEESGGFYLDAGEESFGWVAARYASEEYERQVGRFMREHFPLEESELLAKAVAVTASPSTTFVRQQTQTPIDDIAPSGPVFVGASAFGFDELLLDAQSLEQALIAIQQAVGRYYPPTREDIALLVRTLGERIEAIKGLQDRVVGMSADRALINKVGEVVGQWAVELRQLFARSSNATFRSAVRVPVESLAGIGRRFVDCVEIIRRTAPLATHAASAVQTARTVTPTGQHGRASMSAAERARFLAQAQQRFQGHAARSVPWTSRMGQWFSGVGARASALAHRTVTPATTSAANAVPDGRGKAIVLALGAAAIAAATAGAFVYFASRGDDVGVGTLVGKGGNVQK